MQRKSWNQLNDEDSSLSDSSDDQILDTVVKKLNSMKPPQEVTKNKSSNEQLNLSKLSQHQKKTIWLFIPNYFGQNLFQEVDEILNRMIIWKKKTGSGTKGWNVLTETSNAQDLIINGLQQGKYLIKFYYSNKNQEELKQHKVHKKVSYVQKNKIQIEQNTAREDEAKKERQRFKSPDTKQQKKKTKWVLKSTTSVESQKIQDLSNKNQSQKIISNLKQEIKDLYQIQRQEIKIQEIKNMDISQHPPNKIIIDIEKQENSVKCEKSLTENEIIEKNELNLQNEEIESESSEEVKKKKKKKKKKAKGLVERPKIDSNNPFSYFSIN